MAVNMFGEDIGDMPVRGQDGEIIGEITRVSSFETTTGEVLVESRIWGDVARQGKGFTGECSFRFPSPEKVFRIDPKLLRMVNEVVTEMTREQEEPDGSTEE